MFRPTIRKKIFFYFFFLISLLFVVISIAIYFLIFQSLIKNEIKYAVESTDQTNQTLSYILKSIDNTGNSIGGNEEIISALSSSYQTGDIGFEDSKSDINSMLQNIITFQDYIHGIYLLTPTNTFYTSDEGINIIELKEALSVYLDDNSSSKEKFTGVHNITYHSLSSSPVISYIRPIYNIESNKLIGTIIIDINYNFLKEMITKSSIQNDERVLVVGQNGENIFTYPYNVILDAVIDDNPILLREAKTQIEAKVFGKESIIVSNTIDFTNWKMIRIISSEKALKDINSLKKIAVNIFMAFIIIALYASYMLSSTITKPIMLLNTKIKLVEKGDLSVNVKVESKDELGQLSESFNNMVIKLKTLINKSLEEQKKKSDLEFEILQAQINPHFLYNTLDSIKWLAVIQNINNISDMTTALINLLKYNISKKAETVTLKEELESVSNYVKIQKYRYGDMFSIKFNTMEEILDLKVLRFILQPIVENCIIHGFENTENKGIINVNSYVKNNDLFIEIVDNGIGMEDDVLDDIMSGENKRQKFSGIGVQNIQERVKVYFGEKYGLSFDSNVNEGTKVTLKLPVIKNF